MANQTILLFLFAVVSGTGMNICFKYLAGYSPYLVNGIAGLVAAVVGIIIWLLQKDTALTRSAFHPAMIVLGICFLALNIGFSMLYGQNIPLAYVPIIVTGGMTVLLSLAGWLWFGEQVNWQFIVGAAIILFGMVVLSYE